MTRAPLDLGGGRPTSGSELNIARQVIIRSGVVDALSPLIDSGIGRPRHLSLLGLLVACQLNALGRHHQAHLVEVARTLNAMREAQRRSLDITDWDPDEAYHRVERLFVRLCEVLDSGEAGLNEEWFANELVRAAIPPKYLVSGAVAVDGTDVETWGVLHGEAVTVDLDGEATETQLRGRCSQSCEGSKASSKSARDRSRWSQALYRRSRRSSGTSIGNEQPPCRSLCRLRTPFGVQARDVRWTNHIDRTTLGPEVPGVITTCNLVPAGTHRGRSVVDTLISARDGGQKIEEVVWDPGYSLCKPGSTSVPLAQVGIVQTFQPVTHQRGSRPFSGEALLIDGQLFSSHLPEELRDLPAPPRGASEEEKIANEAKFNQRARWRLVRHAGPDSDGMTVARAVPSALGCFEAVRSRRRWGFSEFPSGALREGSTSCCSGILSVTPVELLWRSAFPTARQPGVLLWGGARSSSL